MRKSTLILALLAAVLCGRAQDFLTPESYGIYSSIRHGDETLYQLLFPEHKSDNVIWDMKYKTFFLCAPSFSEEYALEIGEGQLILTKANQNIYMALSRHLKYRTPDPVKVVSVDVKKMAVPEETCERLSTLFKLATETATHFEDTRLGFDGTSYYFNHKRKLASVWEPEKGRTARLTSIANRLCYAVEHQDTAVLNQQMELCRRLTEEFKQEYPNRYFQPSWVSRSSGDKGPWHCELSGDNCMRLEVLFDTMVSSETAQLVSDLYTDSLAAWSREIFLMNNKPRYPSIVIDNHTDTAICESKEGWHDITISDKLWRRDVILSAAMLPPGRYYFVEGQWKKKE